MPCILPMKYRTFCHILFLYNIPFLLRNSFLSQLRCLNNNDLHTPQAPVPFLLQVYHTIGGTRHSPGAAFHQPLLPDNTGSFFYNFPAAHHLSVSTVPNMTQVHYTPAPSLQPVPYIFPEAAAWHICYTNPSLRNDSSEGSFLPEQQIHAMLSLSPREWSASLAQVQFHTLINLQIRQWYPLRHQSR